MEVIGLVIGVGENSRVRINSKLYKRHKITSLDDYINYATLGTFISMFVLGFIDMLLLGANKRWFINILRWT